MRSVTCTGSLGEMEGRRRWAMPSSCRRGRPAPGRAPPRPRRTGFRVPASSSCVGLCFRRDIDKGDCIPSEASASLFRSRKRGTDLLHPGHLGPPTSLTRGLENPETSLTVSGCPGRGRMPCRRKRSSSWRGARGGCAVRCTIDALARFFRGTGGMVVGRARAAQPGQTARDRCAALVAARHHGWRCSPCGCSPKESAPALARRRRGEDVGKRASVCPSFWGKPSAVFPGSGIVTAQPPRVQCHEM